MIGGGTAVTIAVIALVVLLVSAARDDHIADGVRVGGVDVGGMSAADARAKLVRMLGSAVRGPVTLTYRSKRYVLRTDKAGVRLDAAGSVQAAQDSDGGDVAPRVSYPRAKLQAFIARVAKRVDRPARDADIDMHNGKLVRRHARSGVVVRRPALVTALAAALTRQGTSRTLTVPTRVVERPDRTLADLARRYPAVVGIDRDAKVLRLYKGLRLDRRYKIAVGRQGLESSPGRYKIQEKIVDPPWHAPNDAWAGSLAGQTIPAGDPRNPLVARWMGYHDGEGIHGTKDIASLGEQASHGCIRMSPKAVKELYKQVKVGTPVFLQ
ncbi:MAG: L,D-transpeptidase ErfK/SrfK [Solirubrobacteraceae bacterium]|nr:L,D-transpeptidase ErfK/SrfK [Solirubrobacteraceae bacterium]